MSIYEVDMHEALQGERGERCVCKDCRQVIQGKEDPVLWRVLFEVLRDPRTRLTPKQKEKVIMAAYYHLKEFPDHTIYIWNIKK